MYLILLFCIGFDTADFTNYEKKNWPCKYLNNMCLFRTFQVQKGIISNIRMHLLYLLSGHAFLFSNVMLANFGVKTQFCHVV